MSRQRSKKPFMQRVIPAQELNAFLAAADEDAVHLAVVEHLRSRCKANIFWTHVPNGGHRHPLVGKKLKAMGTRAGVPDLLLLIEGRLHALELKCLHGCASVVQRKVMKELEAAGAVTAIGRGVDEAVGILDSWGVFR
jgi:hypothetical protein